MVLAQPVGRKRSFGLGLFLTVITFGVYAVYWNYKAHNEVYRQFELAREGRDEGMAWYVLGLVVPPLLLGYLWIMASNVAYLRQRIGLPRRQTPGRFLGLVGAGAAALAAGTILLIFAPAPAAEEEPATEPQEETLSQALLTSWLLLTLAAAVLLGLAYHGLQRSINELWDAYHARVAYLVAHPAEAAPAPAPPPGASLFDRVASPPAGPSATYGWPPPPPRASYSYYADLAPPSAQPPAPARVAAPAPASPDALPLQREWERLKAENPGLDAPDVDDLLGSAAAGDPYAHQRAAALVQARKSLVEERRRLQARRESLLGAMRSLEDRRERGEVEAAAHEVERGMLERDLASVRERLEATEARLFGPR